MRARQPVTLALCQVLAACVDPGEPPCAAAAPAPPAAAPGVDDCLRFLLAEARGGGAGGRGEGPWHFAQMLDEIEET